LITQPTTITTGYHEEYPPAIFTHCNSLANFFITHGTSSPSSSSHRQFCSSQEFTFHLFFFTTKVCPDPLNLPNAGDPFAGTSSSSSYSLFSPTRDLIALI
jgi:hypothetical protein